MRPTWWDWLRAHIDWDAQDTWATVMALTIYALLVVMAGLQGG